jgi:hypothetical protein
MMRSARRFSVVAGLVAALTVITASCAFLVSVGFAIAGDDLRSAASYSQQDFLMTKAAADFAFGVFIVAALLATVLVARAVRSNWNIPGVVRWPASFGAVILSSYALVRTGAAGSIPDCVLWMSTLLEQQIARLVR